MQFGFGSVGRCRGDGGISLHRTYHSSPSIKPAPSPGGVFGIRGGPTRVRPPPGAPIARGAAAELGRGGGVVGGRGVRPRLAALVGWIAAPAGRAAELAGVGAAARAGGGRRAPGAEFEGPAELEEAPAPICSAFQCGTAPWRVGTSSPLREGHRWLSFQLCHPASGATSPTLLSHASERRAGYLGR